MNIDDELKLLLNSYAGTYLLDESAITHEIRENTFQEIKALFQHGVCTNCEYGPECDYNIMVPDSDLNRFGCTLFEKKGKRMNIEDQIKFTEQHLKDLRCFPSSDYVLNMYRAILKTLKEVKADKKIEDLCN